MNDPAEIEEGEQERLVGLTPAQSKALAALLSGATQSEAAKAAGVCRQRVSHWVHHDLRFRVNLKKEKQALLRGARTVLAAGALDAANFLRTLLNDPKADINQKLKAADMLLTTSGIDQAPAAWPELNDVELMVSADLADASRHVDATELEVEHAELELARRREFDPEAANQLSRKELTLADEISKVDAQLRKLARHRRLTARQTAQMQALEIRLGELNGEAKGVAARLHQLELLKGVPKDLGVSGLSLSVHPDKHAAYLGMLRREAEQDG